MSPAFVAPHPAATRQAGLARLVGAEPWAAPATGRDLAASSVLNRAADSSHAPRAHATQRGPELPTAQDDALEAAMLLPPPPLQRADEQAGYLQSRTRAVQRDPSPGYEAFAAAFAGLTTHASAVGGDGRSGAIAGPPAPAAIGTGAATRAQSDRAAVSRDVVSDAINEALSPQESDVASVRTLSAQNAQHVIEHLYRMVRMPAHSLHPAVVRAAVNAQGNASHLADAVSRLVTDARQPLIPQRKADLLDEGHDSGWASVERTRVAGPTVLLPALLIDEAKRALETGHVGDDHVRSRLEALGSTQRQVLQEALTSLATQSLPDLDRRWTKAALMASPTSDGLLQALMDATTPASSTPT